MNFQSLVADDELVAMFRRRFLNWKTQDYVKGDALLLPVFDEFLSWENVAPVFSCQGHNPQEGTHVIFVANDKGLEKLVGFYEAVRDRLTEMYRAGETDKKEARLSPFGLQLLFTTRSTSIRQEDPEPYPAVLLTTWPFPKEETRIKFIEVLLEELKRFNAK